MQKYSLFNLSIEKPSFLTAIMLALYYIDGV